MPRALKFRAAPEPIGPATGRALVLSGVADDEAGLLGVTAQLSGEPAPDFEEDFSTYTSDANFKADPRNIYRADTSYGNGAGDGAVLDQAVGYTAGGLSQSLRIDFKDRTALGNRCSDYTPAIINLNGMGSRTEMWVEVYAMFQNGFKSLAPAGWGCASSAAYKLLFLGGGSTSRWDLVGGIFGSRWDASYPGGDYFVDLDDGVSGGQNPNNPFYDGTWHRYRIHAKCSTTASSADGIMQLWLDDTRYINVSNINTRNNDGTLWTPINNIALGRNMNQGPDQLQSYWWGRVRVWFGDPGW